MNKVESFELDHRKVKAPYVRKCCLLEGPKGDKVTRHNRYITYGMQNRILFEHMGR